MVHFGVDWLFLFYETHCKQGNLAERFKYKHWYGFKFYEAKIGILFFLQDNLLYCQGALASHDLRWWWCGQLDGHDPCQFIFDSYAYYPSLSTYITNVYFVVTVMITLLIPILSVFYLVKETRPKFIS